MRGPVGDGFCFKAKALPSDGGGAYPAHWFLPPLRCRLFCRLFMRAVKEK
jgi:hypothetical protein